MELYGSSWPDEYQHPLQVELYAIANDGYWTIGGKRYGMGSFHHLMEARKWIWPNRYRHKWTDLLYRNFVENEITIMMGAASTQKTSHGAEFVCLNY
ncbi:MAG TPA: hypothetical protein VIJ93_11950, partial [bacterium]